MQKIRIMTDSAADLPVETAQRLGIQVLPIPITVDGRSYYERVDLTNEEFYRVLLSCRQIPTTSHINASRYLDEYQKAFQAGNTHLINVTINSMGSNMYNAACLARRLFYEDSGVTESQFCIEVVDSRTYTMAYGLAVRRAAEQAAAGVDFEQILAGLRDWFSRVEIAFSVYSLEFVKKSGRVSCAAAFVGDLLGLRPMIVFSGGAATVVDKVRGDHNVVPKLLEVVKRRADHPQDYPFAVIRGTSVPQGDEFAAAAQAGIAGVHLDGIYSVGSSVAINCGPTVVAAVYAGKKRVD